MSLPEIVGRDEWLQARRQLLAREKELTRQRDELNADRRRLPMVRVEKDYVLQGATGEVHLLDLFEGRRQLIVQHFMFDPSWETGCPSCTADADERSEGLLEHLQARDTTFATVSRAPYAKLDAYRRARGWTFPWYSSVGSDFNYDFHVTIDESVAPMEVNYRGRVELAGASPALRGLTAEDQPFEMPGVSCFLREADEVFHTYSTFGRGTEAVGGAYCYLDLTALGRQEAWEEPKDRVENPHGAVPDFAT
jgi:predicted dithiol-disulfide oxidoreductase (DUF899 family)